MARVVFIHWKREEAEAGLAELAAAGYEPEWLAPNGSDGLRALRENPPAALVIDLSRLPSHGRAVGVEWRKRKATRNVPLVFAGGAGDKVEATRTLLPDAVYATVGELGNAVCRAIRNAPDVPVCPDTMAGYSGTPLPKKLGIKPGSTVALLNPPQGFARKLESLPEGVRFGKCNAHRVLVFVRSQAELKERFAPASGAVAEGGGLWIVYPKQSSGIETDLTQASVRELGMSAGWVDYKVCAVDETWTGLCFARRSAKAARYH